METYDVIVVGAGMAGLVAAARACECGSRVLVLEKGRRAGGSMYLSSGAIWTVDSSERAAQRSPDGRPELQELVVETLPECFDWLSDLGIEFRDISITLPGPGKSIEPAEFTGSMIEFIENCGGDVLLDSPMKSLTVSESDSVTGVKCLLDGDDNPTKVESESVVLATGGFQGSEKLVHEYISTNTERIRLRANPWSTGDGFEAAIRVGAKSSKGLDQFYGHTLPAPPAEFTLFELSTVSQYYGPMAVAIDAHGKRFTDESDSNLESPLTQDVLKKAAGKAYYILDSETYHSTLSTGKPVGRYVESAKDAGGRVAVENSIKKLCDELTNWGVEGERARRTLNVFNEKLYGSEANSLDPPRTRHRKPVDEPPFYAVAVQPGITFTMGGLDVTVRMEVISRSLSSSTFEYIPEQVSDVKIETVDGLYAAGVDVGNVSHRYYLGGLSQALVTGYIAGESASTRDE